MKQKAIIAIINILLFLLLFPMFAGATVVGEFTFVKGRIDVTRADSKAVVVKLGDKVQQGDTIRSKSDSIAEVTFIDKNIMRLSQKSKVSITEYTIGQNSKVLFKLSRGKVQNIVEKFDSAFNRLKKKKFEVHTPTMVVGVRGTDFLTKHVNGISSSSFKKGRGYGFNLRMPKQVYNIGTGHMMHIKDKKAEPIVRKAKKSELISEDLEPLSSNDKTESEENDQETDADENDDNENGDDEQIADDNENGDGEAQTANENVNGGEEQTTDTSENSDGQTADANEASEKPTVGISEDSGDQAAATNEETTEQTAGTNTQNDASKNAQLVNQTSQQNNEIQNNTGDTTQNSDQETVSPPQTTSLTDEGMTQQTTSPSRPSQETLGYTPPVTATPSTSNSIINIVLPSATLNSNLNSGTFASPSTFSNEPTYKLVFL